MVSKKSLDARVKAIKDAVGETVIVTLGIKPNEEPDILDVKCIFGKEANEDASEGVPDYIG